MQVEQRVCEWCSTVFSVLSRRRRKYCGRSCAVAAGNAKGNARIAARRAARRALATCETCGKQFRWDGPRRKKRCSKACTEKAAYDRDPQPTIERARSWRVANPERVAAHWDAWEARNQVKYAVLRSNARARRRAADVGDGVTEAEWIALLDEFQHACAYCESADHLTVDHVVPLARGGRDEAANVVPACLSCNCSKQDRPLAEWLGFC